MSKRVVLTVSGVIPADICEQIASGHPGADYLELPQELPGDFHRWRAGWAALGRAI